MWQTLSKRFLQVTVASPNQWILEWLQQHCIVTARHNGFDSKAVAGLSVERQRELSEVGGPGGWAAGSSEERLSFCDERRAWT